jgi:hypothetical protein
MRRDTIEWLRISSVESLATPWKSTAVFYASGVHATSVSQ